MKVSQAISWTPSCVSDENQAKNKGKVHFSDIIRKHNAFLKFITRIRTMHEFKQFIDNRFQEFPMRSRNDKSNISQASTGILYAL